MYYIVYTHILELFYLSLSSALPPHSPTNHHEKANNNHSLSQEPPLVYDYVRMPILKQPKNQYHYLECQDELPKNIPWDMTGK